MERSFGVVVDFNNKGVRHTVVTAVQVLFRGRRASDLRGQYSYLTISAGP